MSAKSVLLAQFDLHHVLFNNVLDEMTDEEANESIAPPMNRFKWVAGHILTSQGHLARIGGTDVSIPWSEHFESGPGATGQQTSNGTPIPSLEEIKDKWNEVHPAIRQGLENLPDAALDQVIESKHPIYPFNNTLSGLWAFINHHQAYTIGQMGVLRRGHKKEAMKYN